MAESRHEAFERAIADFSARIDEAAALDRERGYLPSEEVAAMCEPTNPGPASRMAREWEAQRAIEQAREPDSTQLAILSPEQRQRAEALVVAEAVMPEDYTVGDLLDVADWIATGSGGFDLETKLEELPPSISVSSGMLRKTHYVGAERHDGMAADCWRCSPLTRNKSTMHYSANGQQHRGSAHGCRFC